MKKCYLFKILFIILILCLLIGCSNNDVSVEQPGLSDNEVKDKGLGEVNTEGFQNLEINLNVLNKDDKDTYYVYFVIPGLKQTEPGKATKGGKSLPYETDLDGKLLIDLANDHNLRDMIMHEDNINPGSLELYVTTTEDIYIRNPLNKETIIDFEVVEDDGFVVDYLLNCSELNIDIEDKYPDGVLSISFPDAVFVIKLHFDQPVNKDVYEVSLFVYDERVETGIGSVRTGRLSKEFYYWETQFYENEITGKRAVVIMDTDDNTIIEYEGYPLWLDFNEDGTCQDGDIINIKMPSGS